MVMFSLRVVTITRPLYQTLFVRHFTSPGIDKRPNGLAFRCRERARNRLQKRTDLAREAVSCNAGLGGRARLRTAFQSIPTAGALARNNVRVLVAQRGGHEAGEPASGVLCSRRCAFGDAGPHRLLIRRERSASARRYERSHGPGVLARRAVRDRPLEW